MPLTINDLAAGLPGPAQAPALDREAWLAEAWNRTGDLFHLSHNASRVTPLPSFPRTRSRSGAILGEIVPVNAGTGGHARIALVSPALSQSVEVVTVLDYLMARLSGLGWRDYHAQRPSSSERHRLAVNGYEAPYSRIVPGPLALERVQVHTAAIVAAVGEYPHEAVTLATTRPQSTRMLKAQCVGGTIPAAPAHPAYIVRISASQAERGLPICPVCHGYGFTQSLTLAS